MSQEGLWLFCFDYGLCSSGSHSWQYHRGGLLSQSQWLITLQCTVSQLYLTRTCLSCVENILKLGFCIKHWVELSCTKCIVECLVSAHGKKQLPFLKLANVCYTCSTKCSTKQKNATSDERFDEPCQVLVQIWSKVFDITISGFCEYHHEPKGY